jgi:hypothetical protein
MLRQPFVKSSRKTEFETVGGKFGNDLDDIKDPNIVPFYGRSTRFTHDEPGLATRRYDLIGFLFREDVR